MTTFSATEKNDLLARAVPIRCLAIEIFDRVFYKGTSLDRAFAPDAGFLALNPRDRALVRMMVTTTLRRLGQIDDVVQAAMNADTPPEPPALSTLLRLSAAQILFMEMPDYAAVNIAVNVAEAIGLHRQKGLVNAVLRRITREGHDYIAGQDSVRTAIPGWMFRDWVRSYGVRTARAIGAAQLTEAPLDLTVKDPKHAKDWAKQLGAEVLPGGTLRIRHPSGGIDTLPGYAEGAWWVQDFSASLPVKIMGTIKGKTIFDVCAAPGGKTAQMLSAGAHVYAIEKSSKRLVLLNQNLERLHLKDSCTIIQADGESWVPADDRRADIVLIDAPCSSTGTLRRNPDIMIHRDSADVARLSKTQAHLLSHATNLIKDNGKIVYAVCSLQRAEGEGQIEKFLKKHPDFVVDPITPKTMDGMDEMMTESGFLRALPSHLADQGGADGFFVAVLVRAKKSGD